MGVNEPSLDHSMRVRPFAETRLHCLPSMAVMSPIPICWVRVVSIRQQQNPAVFVLTHRVKMLLRRLLAVYIGIGDGIVFSAPPRDMICAEILIIKNSGSGWSRYIHRAPTGCVSQPRHDKRNQYLVSAEVRRRRPRHLHDLPALRSPARVLLSPAASCRQS